MTLAIRKWVSIALWSVGAFAAGVLQAGPVTLPFFEDFSTPAEDAVAAYPQFTAQTPNVPGARDPMWRVTENGILRAGTTAWGPTKEPSFSVTPDPKPTGEIIIKVDMGWNGEDNIPTPVPPGNGATGLRLGRFEDTQDSENTLVFHPGYTPIPGALRVEGDGGFGNRDMGWVPAPGVLHHVEIHSFPNGLFNIKVTDGEDSSKVYETSFTNPFAYGGDIGFLSVAGGSPMYDNLSITLAGANPVVQGDYNNNGTVDAADYALWRDGAALQNEGVTLGTNSPEDYDFWRARFGANSGAGAGIVSVPEPSSTVLILSILAVPLFRSCSRTSRCFRTTAVPWGSK